MRILGIHAGHDSGAAIVEDGRVIAAVSEERLNRIHHYGSAPIRSVAWCLDRAGVRSEELDAVALSSLSNEGVRVLLEIPVGRWRDLTGNRGGLQRIKEFAIDRIYPSAVQVPTYVPTFPLGEGIRLVKVDHHRAHAASAYRTGGFDRPLLVVTADGIGEGVSLAVWRGEGGRLDRLAAFGAEGSLGWFYGLVTEALGWWVGEGEGKTMGLAPYGDPEKVPDGAIESFCPRYEGTALASGHDFGRMGHLQIADSFHWHFPEADAIRRLIDAHGPEAVAARTQRILEEEMLGVLDAWADRTGLDEVALAGGIFMNVKLNQRIVASERFRRVHVFPHAGDGGLPVGAALEAAHDLGAPDAPGSIREVLWGPSYSDDAIREVLRTRRVPFREPDSIEEATAELLAAGRIVGWFQGRMEYGPRALGGRSILMDPRKAEHKDVINARVKYREAFRPFCPSIAAERAGEFVVETRPEPFMVTGYTVRPEIRDRFGAVTHVDGTCRPQFVDAEVQPRYHRLLSAFGSRTGVPALLNTSFNIKGEPIVCTPSDAVRCFYDTGMDALAIGRFLIEK